MRSAQTLRIDRSRLAQRIGLYGLVPATAGAVGALVATQPSVAVAGGALVAAGIGSRKSFGRLPLMAACVMALFAFRLILPASVGVLVEAAMVGATIALIG